MNTARPASDTPRTGPSGARPQLRRASAIAIIALLAVLVLAADQASKQWALAALEPGDPVQVVGDALVFVLVFNPGAAFSLGEGVTWIFTIALAVVAIAIVVLMITRVRSRLWAVALGLLLGGVLGNLTDRLLRDPGFPMGHVVDFISTPWMMPAVYNVADIFIVGDMIAIALLILVGIHLNGTRDRGGSSDGDTAVEDSAEDTPADDTAAADGDGHKGAPAADGSPNAV